MEVGGSWWYSVKLLILSVSSPVGAALHPCSCALCPWPAPAALHASAAPNRQLWSPLPATGGVIRVCQHQQRPVCKASRSRPCVYFISASLTCGQPWALQLAQRHQSVGHCSWSSSSCRWVSTLRSVAQPDVPHVCHRRFVSPQLELPGPHDAPTHVSTVLMLRGLLGRVLRAALHWQSRHSWASSCASSCSARAPARLWRGACPAGRRLLCATAGGAAGRPVLWHARPVASHALSVTMLSDPTCLCPNRRRSTMEPTPASPPLCPPTIWRSARVG